jgi:hypothetical protein
MERYEGPNELDIRRNFEGDWATTLQNFTKVLWNVPTPRLRSVSSRFRSFAIGAKTGG